MLETYADGVRLHLHVQPNGKRAEVLGRHGDALKVRIDAPPVDGAANEALLDFVATLLGMPRSNLALVKGTRSRHKVVMVSGLTLDEARTKLAPW